MELGDEMTSLSRLPFIKRRATNNPGLKSQRTIASGFTGFCSRNDSRYRKRRVSLQSRMLVPSGWISYRLAERSTSGVSIDNHNVTAGQPMKGVSLESAPVWYTKPSLPMLKAYV